MEGQRLVRLRSPISQAPARRHLLGFLGSEPGRSGLGIPTFTNFGHQKGTKEGRRYSLVVEMVILRLPYRQKRMELCEITLLQHVQNTKDHSTPWTQDLIPHAS